MATTAGYRDLASQLSDADLLRRADEIRHVTELPGFKFLVDSIAEKERKALDRVINRAAKPEDIRFDQGLVEGLRAVHEAATSILQLADEREQKANAQLEHA